MALTSMWTSSVSWLVHRKDTVTGIFFRLKGKQGFTLGKSVLMHLLCQRS